MPARDGNGPSGMGPGTGRGFGFCGQDREAAAEQFIQGANSWPAGSVGPRGLRGWNKARGGRNRSGYGACGFGGPHGFGLGLGMGRGFGVQHPGAFGYTPTEEERTAYLKLREQALEKELELLQREMTNLQGSGEASATVKSKDTQTNQAQGEEQ